jgi:DNA-binding beta-propeller fold protein YncE
MVEPNEPGPVTSSAAGSQQTPRLFMLQARPPRLLSCERDGTEVVTVIADLGGTPDGVQVDRAKGYIFWTNMGEVTTGEDFDAADGTIERARLDGSERTLLIGNGTIVTPKQLCHDRTHGYLYWCDREGMRVMRAREDGSDVQTLVKRGEGAVDRADRSRHCVGIAVDEVRGLVYWTQKGPPKGGAGRIFRAPVTLPPGSTPETRADIELLADHLPEPIDLHLIDDGNVLLWTDRGKEADGGNTLNRATVTPGGLADRAILAKGFTEAIGLAVDEASGTVFVADLGGNIRAVSLAGHSEVVIHRQGPTTGIFWG